jgi:hypothetical protein
MACLSRHVAMHTERPVGTEGEPWLEHEACLSLIEERIYHHYSRANFGGHISIFGIFYDGFLFPMKILLERAASLWN